MGSWRAACSSKCLETKHALHTHTHTHTHTASEETMSKAVKQMEAGLQKIKTELKQHNKPQDRSDKFAEKMKVNEVATQCQYGR